MSGFNQLGYPDGSFPDGAGYVQNSFPDQVVEDIPPEPNPDACDTGVITREDLLLLAGTASSITVDGQTTVNRPISDLIALDKHLANRRAACASGGNAWGMVGKSKVVPPSAIGNV